METQRRSQSWSLSTRAAQAFLRIKVRPWSGIARRQNTDARLPRTTWGIVTTMAKAFFRITVRPWNGIARRQNRDAPAQNNLGNCYYNGEGVLQDRGRAVRWYRKAAKQGNAAAQTNLGNCYYTGQGVPEDQGEAVKWYHKAAEQGDTDAQESLNRYLHNGTGVPQGHTEAVTPSKAPTPVPHPKARTLECPVCGKRLKVEDEYAGHKSSCPNCKALLRVSSDAGQLILLSTGELEKVVTNPLGMKLVLIPAGEFLMGSPYSDVNAEAFERPQHRVRITKPFYLGVTPVTQEQWTAVMGSNPSYSTGPTNPVNHVSWNRCQQFLETLNRKFGIGGRGRYRFPTEAEREYACRAGSTTRAIASGMMSPG